METVQQILLDSVSGGFWVFIGYYFIITTVLVIPANLIIIAINRPLRHRNIRKHGYPPQHCDADGDFKKNKKNS